MFTDNSRYRKAHNEIVDFVMHQVSIDLNQFRNGDGTSPYTTSYWDVKKRSCICVDWSKMTRNQRNTLLSLKFITVTIGGAWIAYIGIKKTETTTTTPAEATVTTTTVTTAVETAETTENVTAETAPAVKYDRKAVMRRAWEIFHTLQGDRNAKLSYALKMAWAEAKAPAKSLKDQIIEKVEYIVSKASDIYNYEIIARDWANYGKARTYIKVKETSNSSKHYKCYDFGYIDNIANTYIAGNKDANGNFDLAGAYLD
jgi:hypothetical protein